MIEHYTTTELITGFLGLYILVAAGGALLNRQMIPQIAQDLRDREGLRFLSGLYVFTLGALIVSLHNLWSTPIQVFASLVGWVALVEGALLFVAGRQLIAASGRIVRNETVTRGLMVAGVVLGGFLVILGFGWR